MIVTNVGLIDVAPAARTKQRSTPAARARRHMIPVFDVPSGTVELALAYCRCLYQQQVERADGAMRAWEEHFFELDSKTLCDLAKVWRAVGLEEPSGVIS